MPAMTSSIGDDHQLSDGIDEVGRGGIALAAASPRQAQFGVGATPAEDRHELVARDSGVVNTQLMRL